MQEKGLRLASLSSHFGQDWVRKHVKLQLSERFLFFLFFLFTKGRRIPLWFDRAVENLDYGSFADSSYKMPSGVLSHILPRSHKATSAVAASHSKDRTSYQIFSSSHGGGGTQACLHDDCCQFIQEEESRLGPKLTPGSMKALHVSCIIAGTNKHHHTYTDTQRRDWAKAQGGECLIFPAECHSLIPFVAPWVCVCVFPPWTAAQRE